MGLSRGFIDTETTEDSEDVEDVVFETMSERIAARDTYITSSGAGVTKIRSYVVSVKDGDEIQLRGGSTGASFQGFFFWSKMDFDFSVISPVALLVFKNKKLNLNKDLSKREGRQFAEASTRILGETARDQENIDLAFDALKDIRKLQDDAGINVIHEDEMISLNPGETFTVKNRENAIADEFFTEREGFIQWAFGFQVWEGQFNEAFNEGDTFGAKIERLTKFKGIATKLFKLFRPLEGGPTDFEIAPEEEGGFAITTEPIGAAVRDFFGGLGETLGPIVKAAVVVLVALAAFFLLIMFRVPLQSVASSLGDLVKDAVTRGR